MTFKKAEMAKTLWNGLSMIEMNPYNHNWSDFVIQLGLALHQFQKKLLLNAYVPEGGNEGEMVAIPISFSIFDSCDMKSL